MAVNTHLYFGNYITDRLQEFNALIDWLISRLKSNSSAYYPNFMLFGDLNLDYDEPRRDRARIEERIKTGPTSTSPSSMSIRAARRSSGPTGG